MHTGLILHPFIFQNKHRRKENVAKGKAAFTRDVKMERANTKIACLLKFKNKILGLLRKPHSRAPLWLQLQDPAPITPSGGL